MKRLLLILTVALTSLAMRAETVSQKQAQLLANTFFNEMSGKVVAPPKAVYNGRKLTTNRLINPFYVYNNPSGGFVIISAENKAYPILGFSLKDNFNPDRLGDPELAILRSYAKEIELIRYDSEPVEEAIKAWQDYPGYVKDILDSPYIATDPKISIEQSYRLLDDSMDEDRAVYSDLYTPMQWREMILDELRLKEVAPLGFVFNGQIYPTVVYGHQGSYFRIEMSERNNWLMRLNATEVIPSDMISVVVNPLELSYDVEEEQPFETHDTFLEEVGEIERRRNAESSISRVDLNLSPRLISNGSGHFEIIVPEEVSDAYVYNLSGALVRAYKYADTQSAHVDISANPSGFYFVKVRGISGTPYGFKIYR